MKLKLASALLALSAVGLSGCGFTPVYGNNVTAEQGSIQINQIDGAHGHVLRRELILLLRPGVPGVERGVLDVQAESRIAVFSDQREGANRRTEAFVEAKYKLITDKGSISGTVTGSSSAFTNQEPYDDIFSRREATNRAAMEAARLLVNDLNIKAGRDDAFTSDDSSR